jgi:hypothetical protein
MDATRPVERANEEAIEADRREEVEAHTPPIAPIAPIALLLLVLLTRAVDLVLAVAKFNKLLQKLLATPLSGLDFLPSVGQPDYRKILDVARLIACAKDKPGRVDLLDPALPKHHVLQAPEHTRANLLRAASGINDALALLVTEAPVPEPAASVPAAGTKSSALASAVPVPEATYEDYASAGLVPVLVTVTHCAEGTDGTERTEGLRVANSAGRPTLLVPGALRLDREDALAALAPLTSHQSPFAREALALRGHDDPFLAMLAALPKRTLFRFKVLLDVLVLYHEPTKAWFYQTRINYDAAWAALHDSNRAKTSSVADADPDPVAVALTDHLHRKFAACVTLARIALSAGGSGFLRYYVPAADCPSASASDDTDTDTRTERRPAKVARTATGLRAKGPKARA